MASGQAARTPEREIYGPWTDACGWGSTSTVDAMLMMMPVE